jgi:dynein heavy chain 2
MTVTQEWLEICRVESFDIMKLLSSESEMLGWKADGLPSDSLTMQNAIVLLNSTAKVPFIIDPATSATKWLQHHLGKVCIVCVAGGRDSNSATHRVCVCV